jgi:hypothetical protein
MKKNIVLMLVMVSIFTGGAYAKDFYVNPVNGSVDNDGSKEKPWLTLQEVFSNKLIQTKNWEKLPYSKGAELKIKNSEGIIKSGDTIWLYGGEHGTIKVNGYYNDDFITIKAVEGEKPVLNGFNIQSGSFWKLSGLQFLASTNSTEKGVFASLVSHGWNGPANDFIVENCCFSSAEDTSEWTLDDWNKRALTAINTDAPRSIITNNYAKNIDAGINVRASASNSLIAYNKIENFANDGMRGLADDCVFEYNIVKNCYDVNANHDDCFQSWTTLKNEDGSQKPVKNITLRGNLFINFEDPKQPFRGTLQGIGCFDGPYENFVIENNVIMIDQWHGITVMGAINCKVINNTVVDPDPATLPGPCWIMIRGTKKNSENASGSVVRNNITPGISKEDTGNTLFENNLLIKGMSEEQLNDLFVDFYGRDLRLKEGSKAIDAGSSVGAPNIDVLKTPRPQGEKVDIGAYEFKK